MIARELSALRPSCVCSKRVIVKHAGDEEANMAALPLQREHTVFNTVFMNVINCEGITLVQHKTKIQSPSSSRKTFVHPNTN